MKRALVLLLLSACAAAPSPLRASAPKTARVAITIASDTKVEQRVLVTMAIDQPVKSLRGAKPEGLELHDERGRLETKPDGERLELARPSQGTLHVRYYVTLPAKTRALAEPIELRVSGAEVLLLPDWEEKLPVDIHLRTGVLETGGASSLAIGTDEHVTATSAELRLSYFLGGAIGTAVFHAGDGNDFTAWSGFTAFDPRWIGAQTAGIRSAVDTYMGRGPSTDSPPLSFLISSTKVPRGEPLFVVAPAAHGIVALVDPRASWMPMARILVAQALVERYIGGYLTVGDANDAFFSAGFSRAIARDVLTEVGLLDVHDRASELNALLAATVFATEPRVTEMARGALAATSFKKPLRDFVRAMLEGPQHTSREAFDKAIAGVTADLPPDMLAPCYRLVKKDLVPFELGFVASDGEEIKVASVTAGSHAAAAGLREGDTVKDLAYREGSGSVPVTLTVIHDGKEKKLHFLPAGPPKPGRVFERVPGIPDDKCI